MVWKIEIYHEGISWRVWRARFASAKVAVAAFATDSILCFAASLSSLLFVRLELTFSENFENLRSQSPAGVVKTSAALNRSEIWFLIDWWGFQNRSDILYLDFHDFSSIFSLVPRPAGASKHEICLLGTSLRLTFGAISPSSDGVRRQTNIFFLTSAHVRTARSG